MGEIADSLLDGTMCEGCGVYLAGESPGYPRYCSKQCANDRNPNIVNEFSEDEDINHDDFGKLEEVLKQFEKMAWKKKCKCLKGNHHSTCKVNKNRKLAKEAWNNYKALVALCREY